MLQKQQVEEMKVLIINCLMNCVKLIENFIEALKVIDVPINWKKINWINKQSIQNVSNTLNHNSSIRLHNLKHYKQLILIQSKKHYH